MSCPSSIRHDPGDGAPGPGPDSNTAVLAVAPIRDAEQLAHDGGPEQRPLPNITGFEIIMELGRGGMGVVYLARQIKLKRLVALKMILAGNYASAKELGRFRAEAEAVARLQHPNIVQIHEIGEQGGLPYFSLEYVAGGSLEKLMDGSMPEPRAIAQLIAVLARAVYYAHERGIVHRDLKPSNILLTPDGTPKITDFSLAKLLDNDASLTPTEAVIGTPNYMSPEQAAGHTRDVGPAADIFSLGAILYELLAGRPPFKGTSLLDTLEQLRTREPVPAARFRARLPRELDIITLKCLEKSPEKRYPSALALAQDLERFLAGHTIHARRTPGWVRLLKWARRRPAVAGMAAMVMVILVSLIATVPRYRHLSLQASLQQSQQQYRDFIRLRDQALFHGMMAGSSGSLFTGADLMDQRKQAAASASAALYLAGVRPEEGRVDLVRFPDVPTDQIRADCYTLVLVEADATARADRYADALQLLDFAPRLDYSTRAYHVQRAALLDRLGRAAEAAQERQSAQQALSQTALDHFLNGEAMYRAGRTPQAAAEFEKALGLRPDGFWSRFYLSLCHLRLQRWEAARAGLNACLVQQPEFVWIYLFRSVANEKLGAYAAAQADFEQALRLHPEGDARYVLLMNRGVLAFEQKEFGQAAEDFRQAADLKPDQYNARLNLARVYLAQHEFAAAAAEMDRVLRLRPPPVVGAAYHLERARAFYADKNYAAAAEASATALHLLPGEPEALRLAGLSLLSLGHYDEAAKAFDQYIHRRGPPDGDVFRARGQARMKLALYLEAVDDYTRALQLQPTADLYLHRGWAYFFADGWRLAQRDFARAVQMQPTNPDAYAGQGLARVMLGDYQAAVVDAEQAFRLRPATPEMMHNVACIFAHAVAQSQRSQHAQHTSTLSLHYQRRAVETLRQAVLMVTPKCRAEFWRNKVAPDAALNPVRACPEFQHLAEFALAGDNPS